MLYNIILELKELSGNIQINFAFLKIPDQQELILLRMSKIFQDLLCHANTTKNSIKFELGNVHKHIRAHLAEYVDFPNLHLKLSHIRYFKKKTAQD